MQVYEIETKNGRIFRIAVDNRSQEKRLFKVIADNKKKSYEIFNRVECRTNGIHNIKDFEAIAETLI